MKRPLMLFIIMKVIFVKQHIKFLIAKRDEIWAIMQMGTLK